MNLTDKEVDFFKYFISQYHEHFKKAEFIEANHCSVAVLLELERLLESVAHCENTACCEMIPDEPRCAHCFEDGIFKNGIYFVTVYAEGRAFWLCEEHYQIAWKKMIKK